jgi:hypothetical protein
MWVWLMLSATYCDQILKVPLLYTLYSIKFYHSANVIILPH